eukprot:TRINITY_DN71653_c2_g1_i1.p1 TRINITY_DN71653_c2_g1~~TRINITY_DN71653_c2_g1_i1.p1  ORF type:complete len:678 (-),score=108.49 TRINITY_DN71653_c2_g1_i1:2813-4699(-)
MKGVRITLVGKKSDPYLMQCKAALSAIKSKNPYISSTELSLFETEWEEYLRQVQRTHGGRFLHHKKSPLVFFDDADYLGGAEAFLAWAEEHYDYHDATNIALYNRRCQEILKRMYSDDPSRKYCYMDIQVGKDIPTTVIFELFVDIAPQTCNNFIELCKGFTDSKDRSITYRGTKIHRVVPHAFIQGGKIDHGHSIYGGEFADEAFSVKHDTVGILGMAKRRSMPHTNECQFYVTLAAPLSFMDKKYVAFGRVVQGFRVFKVMEKMSNNISQTPEEKCKIVECGIYEHGKPRVPHKDKKPNKDESEDKKKKKKKDKDKDKKDKKKKDKDLEKDDKKKKNKDKDSDKEEDDKKKKKQDKGDKDSGDDKSKEKKDKDEIEEEPEDKVDRLVGELKEGKGKLDEVRATFSIIAKYLTDDALLEKFAMKKFDAIDTDHNQTLSLDELSAYMNKTFEKKGLPKATSKQITILMNRYDRDQNGVLSRKEFIPFVMDMFKSSRQTLITEYGEAKALKLSEKFKSEGQWDSKGIAELDALLSEAKSFYVELRKQARTLNKATANDLTIEDIANICGVFCKAHGAPAIPKEEVEEIIKDVCVTTSTTVFTQSDLRIITIIVVNVSKSILRILTSQTH